jgi:thioredoxin-related protein
MRRALTIVLIVAALVARADAAPSSGKIQWATGFADALAAASVAHKSVMVEFWAEWCGWCHVIERTTFADANVVRLLGDFVAVRVDTEGSPAQARVAARYRVTGLPTILFLTPQGRVVLQVSGYQPPEQFARTLTEVHAQAAQVQAWEQAIAARPDDAAALVKLGLHALANEDMDDGRDLLTRAYRRDQLLPVSERKRLRLALGAVRGIDRKYAESETLLKEGLALTPVDKDGDAQTLLTLARLYMSWGKREDARAQLGRLLKDFPGSPAAERGRQLLAFLEAETGR